MTQLKKRTVIVTSNTGVAVPGMGRLGKGLHEGVELTPDQIEALKADPAAQVLTATEYAKTQKKLEE